jgi:hypothetical protein
MGAEKQGLFLPIEQVVLQLKVDSALRLSDMDSREVSKMSSKNTLFFVH